MTATTTALPRLAERPARFALVLLCALAAAGGAGAATPGEATDLLLTGYDAGAGTISLTFQPACGTVDHNVEYGLLEDVAGPAYAGQVCNVGNGTGNIPDPGPGSYFFLVVGNDGVTTEGSYGLSRIAGVEAERPEDLLDPVCAFDQDLSQRCDGPFLPTLDLTVFRPQSEFYGQPLQRRPVPEAEEEDPGAGIRVNGDDDDGDAVPDRNDDAVAGENDLIELALAADPPVPAAGFAYVLRRSDPALRVWADPTKGVAVLDGLDESPVDLSSGPISLWAENPVGGAADLELLAVNLDDASVAGIDAVHLYPFTGIVIALGGEGQVPGDPTLDPGNHGTFEIAITLHQMGYDVHMYDEDVVVADGSGAAFNEVARAVRDRDVSSVAIYGYSHGGGSTVDLAVRLDQNRGAIGVFSIDFTAYVDGIRNNSDIDIATETQLPPTNYHANYYENPGCGLFTLCGGPIAGADVNMDFGTTYTHFEIDDAPEVTGDLLDRLVAHVAK
ncbi:MAG: hypothetical protein PVF68_10955 [Acidobacteriota bacterium]|jgi:hypothetical protein